VRTVHLLNIKKNPFENNDYQYILRGIIYFGVDHFTSHIITDQTLIWYHGGMETAADVEYEGTIGNKGVLGS